MVSLSVNQTELVKSAMEEVKNTDDLIKIYEEKIKLYKSDIENMKLRKKHFEKQIEERLKENGI